MKLKFNLFVVTSAVSSVALSSYGFAAQIYKDVTTTDINTIGNWSTTSGTDTPNPSSFGTTDTLRFNEYFAPTSGINYTASLSADLVVGGIKVDSGNAGGGTAFGNIIINGTNTLTLNGTASADSQYAGAIFVLNSATGGTLTVNPNIIIGAASTQIVASRNLTLNGTLNWGTYGMSNNIAGGTTTVSGVVSGSGNWSKSGTGTYYFNNVGNTFSGTVTVSAGTLKVDKLAIGGSNSSIGSGSSTITLSGGATLNYVGSTTDTTDRSITLGGSAVISNDGTGTISFTAANVAQTGTASARTLTLGGTNANANTFGSILGDSGTGANISSLTKSGAGTWILTGVNNYTGTTSIGGGGILRVTGSGTLGGLTGSSGDANNILFTGTAANTTLEFETAANLGVASQIRFRTTGGGPGILRYIGTTNETLSKALQCDTSFGLRIESNSVGGSLDYSGSWAASSSARPVYLGGTGTGANTISGAITASTLTKVDAGTWILSGANAYAGGTTLRAGTLVAKNNSAFGTSGTITVNDASTGANNTNLLIDATSANITIGRSITVANLGSGTSTLGSATTSGSNQAIFSGAITLAKNVTLKNSGVGDRLQFSGGISGTGDVTIDGAVAGSKTVFITTANTFTGNVYVTGTGKLQLSDGTATSTSFIPDASSLNLNASGGAFNLAKGGNNETIDALNGVVGTTVSGISGNDTLTVGNSNGSGSYAGVISGTLALTKAGTGTQTISGANSYSGATNINGGKLVIAGNQTGNGQLIVSNAATLTFGDGSSTNGSSVNSGTIFVNNTGTVQINKADGGTVTNAIASNPSATTTLSGANASGTTNTFTATSYNNGGGFAVNSTNTGAVLAFSGSAGAIDLKGTNLTVSGSGDTLLTSAGQGFYSSTTASNVIKSGTGTLIYQGNQGYTGTTAIDAGTVRVDTAQTNSGTYFVGNGGTTGTAAALLLGGGSAGLSGGVNFNRTVSINPGNGSNRTIGGTNTSGRNTFSSAINMSGSFGENRSVTLTAASGGTVEFTGIISGAGQNISKSGDGTVVLTNTNDYTGTTTVNAGTLVVNGNQSSATGAVTVSNTGSRLMGTGTVGGATTINSGAIHSSGSATGAVGSQSFSSDLTYANGSIFEWDINANSTSTGFDTVAVTGNLNGSTDGDTSIFRVVFGATAKTGIDDSGNAFWNTPSTNRVWSMTSLFGKNFTTGLFTSVETYDANGAYNVSSKGAFTITGSSLTWTAVPEPNSVLAGLLVAAGLLRRRRGR